MVSSSALQIWHFRLMFSIPVPLLYSLPSGFYLYISCPGSLPLHPLNPSYPLSIRSCAAKACFMFSSFPRGCGKEMSWRCCGPDSGKSNFVFALWYLVFLYLISLFLFFMGSAFFCFLWFPSLLAMDWNACNINYGDYCYTNLPLLAIILFLLFYVV